MNDLYTSITERIVASLEAGVPPWLPEYGATIRREMSSRFSLTAEAINGASTSMNMGNSS